ncbi:hypothetical protein YB2330_004916 [Saitoella coloradoensis]
MQLYSASFAAALGFLSALVDVGGKVETNDCLNVLSAVVDGDVKYKIVLWPMCHFLTASRDAWMSDNRAKVDVLCDAVDLVREVLLSELETHVACTMLPAVNYTLQTLMNGKETTALGEGSPFYRVRDAEAASLATHSKSLSKDLQKALEIAISMKDTTSIALIYPVMEKMSETEKGDTWNEEMPEVKVRLQLPDLSGDSEIDVEKEKRPFRIWRPYTGSAGVLLTRFQK